MDEPRPPKSAPGAARTALCVLWISAVAAAYCVTYSSSLVQQAGRAAGRFPLLGRILELLHLGS